MNTLNETISKGIFLTDGGLETTLVFQKGIELNHFAAFELLNSENGVEALKNYYRPYLDIAYRYSLNFIMESPTWRANPDWGFKLGYNAAQLTMINKQAIRLMRDIVSASYKGNRNVLVSGCIGPRGDGYIAGSMTASEARWYHNDQVQTFAMADADLVTAMTLNYSDEAIGIVLAAKSFNIPVVISFTVETDGSLPNGEQVKHAILKVDQKTDGYTSYFMINCAHPEHFGHIFTKEPWTRRIKGIRANASTKSHAELDECQILDTGDKELLCNGYKSIMQNLPGIKVIGGCCGTDHTHLEALCSNITNSLYSH